MIFQKKEEKKKLKVGVVSTDAIPHVIRNGDNYSGIAIDIWKAIAKKADIDFKFVEAGNNQDEAISKIQKGSLDVLVGPYYISNKRYQHVDFTIPYFLSDVGVASVYKVNNLENYIIISKILASVIFLFVSLLFLNKFIHNFDKDANFADYFMNSIPDFKDRKMWILYTIIFLSIAILYINIFTPNFNLGTSSIRGQKLIFSGHPVHKHIIKKHKSKGVVVSNNQTADHYKQVNNNLLFDKYIKNTDSHFGILDDTAKLEYILHHNIDEHKNIDIIRRNLSYSKLSFVLPKKSKYIDKINSALREIQKEKVSQIIVKKYLGNKFDNHVTF